MLRKSSKEIFIKYFSHTRNAKFRNKIVTFQAFEDETLNEAWERFKKVLRKSRREIFFEVYATH